MGHRGSFAVRKDGRTQLYRSQFGGIYLVRSCFYGPDRALESFEASQEVDYLLDDVYCEGAAFLDWDAKVLVFVQDHTQYHPELRQYLLALMKFNWPGWRLRWASGGIVEIASLLGIDPQSVRCIEDGDFEEEAPEWDAPLEWVGSILTLQDGAVVGDYCLECGILNALAIGPEVIRMLVGREPCKWTLADLDEMECGANIDVEGREISLWFVTSKDNEWVERLRRRWPGWTILRHDEGLPGQLERSGRDPAIGRFGEKEILRQIVCLLFEDDEIDPTLILDHLGMQRRPARTLPPGSLKSEWAQRHFDPRIAVLGETLSQFRRARSHRGSSSSNGH